MKIKSVSAYESHRKGIYREAINLKNSGWYVMADHIPGFEAPPELEGHIPDIFALKDKITLIIEIETDLEDNDEQHAAFRKYVRGYSNTEFYGWLVDTSGCRITKFE